ncbi:hypothetical protein [Negadavirga shengliensis]|uniref:Outer membrane protein beta-barrel domain-containing protein n=1 Tax=Negadavirga shengliensis TaxID=1389218 RepID=A0ABV9SZ36_9BACT
MKTLKILLFILALGCSLSQRVNAQSKDWKQDKKIALVFGLTQPLVVSGFNVEVNYIHNRLIFDYSHGISLDLSGSLLPDYLQSQGLVVHMPFSTGFGIGYRFTEWLNLRVEPKWHRFEFYYEGDVQTIENRIGVDANNYSVGPGLYGFFQPFKKKENALKGITVAPSVRFWPTVASSFDNNAYRYENTRTGQTEELKSLASGIGFSPLIVNVSIGYTFDLKRNK